MRDAYAKAALCTAAVCQCESIEFIANQVCITVAAILNLIWRHIKVLFTIHKLVGFLPLKYVWLARSVCDEMHYG